MPLLAFVVTTSTTTSSSLAAAINIPGTSSVILLLIRCAIIVLVTWRILPSLATTLALIKSIGNTLLGIEVLSNIVSARVGTKSRLELLILEMIWLRVLPALVEVVGISTVLALVLRLVIISLWSYRVLAKKFFVKISFNKRALSLNFGAQNSEMIGRFWLTYLGWKFARIDWWSWKNLLSGVCCLL